MNLPYFAYGSNMNLDQMAVRCPGSRFLTLVAKRGWRFIINQRGYVTAVDDPSEQTLGCLWELSDEDWSELDRYEGVSAGYYDRVDCEVIRMDSEERVSAIAYRATNEIPGIPNPPYADAVIHGAVQIGLPKEYLGMIEAWRNGPPSF
ncbi:MAG: gamma-glutamylcyclotransferase family protein [Opitutales bacterium]